ncbi:MAG: HemD protein, partial [Crenarchaeota archaeon]|nr:HemD protein [Thermoproteota archaeon]
ANAGTIARWSKLASAVDTIVILMGVEPLETTAAKLMEGGLDPDTPVAIIEQGTSKNQRSLIGKLNTITKEARERNVKAPAVIVVGKVATLGEKLSWFKKTPR